MIGTPILTTLPASDEEQAIDAILQVLRSDPGLTGAGVAIWADEGTAYRMQSRPFVPDEAQLPLIRLRDGLYPIQAESERSHRGRLTLDFDLYSPGCHYADRFRLWHAFTAALFAADPARRAWIESTMAAVPNLSRREVTLISGGAEVVLLGADQYAIRATASLYLPFTVHTLL